MNNVYKISILQFIAIPYFLYQTFNNTPHILYVSAQDSWFPILIAIPIEIIIIKFILSFSKKMPDTDIIEYSQNSSGKTVGTLFSLIFVVGILLQFTFILNVLTKYIQSNLLPSMNITIIMFLSTIVLIYAIKLGYENFSRIGFLIFIAFLLTVVLGSLGLIFQANFSFLRPSFINGLFQPTLAVLIIISTNTVWLSLLLFFPRNTLANPRNYNKGVWIAFALAKAVAFIRTFFHITILGGDFPLNLRHPGVEITRQIFISEFIERFDILILFETSITSIFSLMLFFYCICVGFQKIFGLKETKYLAIPIAIISITLSQVITPSIFFATSWLLSAGIFFSIFIALIIPIMIFLMGLISNKKGSVSTKRQAN